LDAVRADHPGATTGPGLAQAVLAVDLALAALLAGLALEQLLRVRAHRQRAATPRPGRPVRRVLLGAGGALLLAVMIGGPLGLLIALGQGHGITTVEGAPASLRTAFVTIPGLLALAGVLAVTGLSPGPSRTP
jgi:hypothetical protein